MFTDPERQAKFEELMAQFKLSDSDRKELEEFIDEVMTDSFTNGVCAGRG